MYVEAAAAAPDVTFAQFNNANDGVRSGFLYLLGTPAPSLVPHVRDNLAEIRTAVPQFRSYTAAGEEHLVLTRDSYYTTTVDGMPLHQWVNGLVAGREVGDVVAPDAR